jgi:hypothetical protein
MHVLPVKTAISYEVLGNSFALEPGRMVEKNKAAASRKDEDGRAVECARRANGATIRY